MSTGKRLLRNFIFLSTGQIGGLFIQAYAMIHIARALGAEIFGKLSFAQAIFPYFVALSTRALLLSLYEK
ncbi:MAG: hypothetical protein ABIH42_11335 [Planctomycetota bacterium]